uniref:Uncharacterized protein n=1 Tax=Echinococcus canadensis TaxID=519352 RepID=A0A915EXT7_9CEST
LNDLQIDNKTAALKGATKVEALVFCMGYPLIIVLSHLWTLGYNKSLNEIVVRHFRPRMLCICRHHANGVVYDSTSPLAHDHARCADLLHVICGRFGSTAHLILCTFALLNSFYIVATTTKIGNRLVSSISIEITFDLVWIVAITIAGICMSWANVRQVFPVCYVGSRFLMLPSIAFFIGVYLLSSNPKPGTINGIYEANVVEDVLYSNKINRIDGLAPLSMDQATWRQVREALEFCGIHAVNNSSLRLCHGLQQWFHLAGTTRRIATACKQMHIPISSDLTTQTSVVVAEALFGRGGLLVFFMMYAFIIVNICVFQLFTISSILTFDIYAIDMRCARTPIDVYSGERHKNLSSGQKTIVSVPLNSCAAKGPVLPSCKCGIHAECKNYKKRLENVHRSSTLVILAVVLPIGPLFNLLNVRQNTMSHDIRINATGVVVGTALSTSMAGLVRVLMSTLTRLYPNLGIGKAAFGLIRCKS